MTHFSNSNLPEKDKVFMLHPSSLCLHLSTRDE